VRFSLIDFGFILDTRRSLTENDFLMGREREDGHIYFVGGLVAFPGVCWTLYNVMRGTENFLSRILPFV
jgi:hypothetical protein